jgi:hypothetical protein
MHPGIKADPFIIEAGRVKEPEFHKKIENAVSLSIIGAGLKAS